MLSLALIYFVVEGPSVEIGVNLSRGITTIMDPQKYLPTSVNVVEVMKHNRLLLACGGAAGVAAGFNAPIAGIFFALEVIQTTFRSVGSSTITKQQANADGETIVINEKDVVDNLLSTKGGISSIVLSSVLAALVCEAILGHELVFRVTEYSLKTPLLELPLYLLLGSLSGVLAYLFSQLNSSSKQLFDGELGWQPVRNMMTSIPSVVKPVIGGLFCGLVGMYYPQILFFGYETLNNLLTKTSLSTELLVTLLAVKMLTTSVASGSGKLTLTVLISCQNYARNLFNQYIEPLSVFSRRLSWWDICAIFILWWYVRCFIP
jgi:H+/Cl- antiporter ClcA